MAIPGLDTYGARSSHGSPPYAESAAKAALRFSLAHGGFQASLAGLGAVPRGANFGAALLAAAGASSRATSAAEQAAREYAMKQAQMEETAQQREIQNRYTEALIKRAEKPDKPEKVEPYQLPAEQQAALIDFETRKAKALASAKGTEGRGFTETPWYMDTKNPMYNSAEAKRARAALGDKPEGDTAWMSGLMRTTRSGKQFLDVSELQGKEKAAAVKYGTLQGIRAIGSTELGQLQDVDTARGNIQDIKDYIGEILPKDAQGRTLQYPGIKLSAILQTNEKRAAFGAWRAAAIRNLRAMAGSKGLRINQAEINLAIKNDIPNITDTYGVAFRKLQTVDSMLDNAENPLLQKNWAPVAPIPSAPAATDGDRAYLKSLGL